MSNVTICIAIIIVTEAYRLKVKKLWIGFML